MYNVLCTSITQGRYGESALLFAAMLIVAMSFSSAANFLTIQAFNYWKNRVAAVIFVIALFIGFLFVLIGPDLHYSRDVLNYFKG